jgi:general secretion pathway protein I
LDCRGFALLEVLVAFIITILAVSLIIGATSDGLRGSRTAASYQEATVRAQSRLEAAANAGTPKLGERNGDDGGGFRWRERVAALRGSASPAQERPLTLYEISVWIDWSDGIRTRSVRLDTQRVGESQAR